MGLGRLLRYSICVNPTCPTFLTMKTTTRSLLPFALASLFASCGGEISLPDDAKGTAETVLSNLAENKPQVLWSALPESYRTDANDVARAAIATIDPDVYDKALGILKKANKILTEKKEYILKNETVSALAEDKDKLSDDWDNFTELLDVLLDSQLGSYETAKEIDLGDLLADTGGDLMNKLAAISALTSEDKWKNEFVAKTNAVKVEEVSTSGEETVLRITDPDGGVEEHPWVKVEGKWIPKVLQIGWKEGIAEAKADIAAKEAAKAEDKAGVLFVLNMVDGVLDQLDQAESQEEFEAALKGIASLGGGFGG